MSYCIGSDCNVWMRFEESVGFWGDCCVEMGESVELVVGESVVGLGIC